MGKTQQKLLVICGPTATGKTNLALQLIKLFPAEVISADSRQVYIGMDIGTGKDKPKDVVIHGYDLADPRQDFNVSLYQKITRDIVQKIWDKNKLPILVGGSGFYIKSIVDNIQSIDVTVDSHLREILEGKSAFELFNMLAKLSPQRAQKMNNSDRNNPRRLIRAIEIYSAFGSDTELSNEDLEANCLFIGLMAQSEVIKERIEKRVDERIRQGMETEVVNLLRKGVEWDTKAMHTPGYRQFQGYLKGEYDVNQLRQQWILDEVHYAKRQMTWFKKDKRVNWFDISDPEYQEKVAKLVKKWYSNENESES